MSEYKKTAYEMSASLVGSEICIRDRIIADVQGKELKYEMVDFHSTRPGHDLRYALSGEKMRKMGWEPQNIRDRIREVVEWTLANERWIKL